MNNPFHYQHLEYRRVEQMVGGWIKQNPENTLKVLDFGCGRGKYLHLLSALGCTVCGIDANPEYVAENRGNGFNVLHPNELASCETKFDLIFLSHVVEHLTPQELIGLVPSLCDLLEEGGRLVVITPVLGERFYHDFSHIRPYYPQSIRHAFGQQDAPLLFGGRGLIVLTDIYFFKDPFRTRTWRAFYINKGVWGKTVRLLNKGFDYIWYASGGRFGAMASWLGVYEKINAQKAD